MQCLLAETGDARTALEARLAGDVTGHDALALRAVLASEPHADGEAAARDRERLEAVAVSRENGWVGVFVTAEALLGAGLLQRTERLCDLGLELWRGESWWAQVSFLDLRAAASLELGRTNEVVARLADYEDFLAAPESAPPSRAVASFYLVRLHAARTRLFLSLGLIDEAEQSLELLAACSKPALEETEPDDVRASVNTELVLQRADFELARSNPRAAIRCIEDAFENEERLPILELHRPVLELSLANAELQEDWRRSGEPRCRATLAGLLERGGLSGETTLRAHCMQAESYLLRGELEGCERVLARAREFVRRSDPSGVLETEIHLTALETRAGLRTGRDAAVLLEAFERPFDAFLAAWHSAPLREGGIGYLHDPERREVLCAMVEVHVAALGEEAGLERAVNELIQAQAAGTMARTFGLEVPDVRALSSALAKDEGILLYLPGRFASYAITIDREGLDRFELESSTRLVLRARNFADRLASFSRLAREDGDALRSLAAASHRLGAELLPEDLQRRLSRWRHVIVSGTEFLSSVPLEAVSPTEGELFGWEHAVTTVPSLPLLWHLFQAPRNESGSTLLVADLDPRGLDRERFPVEALSFGERELERLFDGAAVDAWLAPELDETVLREERARLERAALVHFFLHGGRSDDLELPAALLCARAAGTDGVLTCREVAELAFTGTVILSSCEAARGSRRVGDDDLAHLGGAFLRAGARCVVLARGALEFEASLDFMRIVHERLRAGDPIAEALRIARARRGTDLWRAFHDARVLALGLGVER